MSDRTLGAIVRGIRNRMGMTLKDFGAQVGISPSALSKIENDKLSLSYEKLVAFAEQLGLSLSEFLQSEEAAPSRTKQVTARRSIANESNTLLVDTKNYHHEYLNTDLRGKLMVPILVDVRARSIEEYGELTHHSGEEFILVIEGEIEVHSQFYEPVTLTQGQSIYIDSSMGHAYIAKGGETARILAVCAATRGTLQDELIEATSGVSIN